MSKQTFQNKAMTWLSPYLTSMETSWRPDGDSRPAETSPQCLFESRGSRGGIKHVQFFLRLFGDFCKSPVSLPRCRGNVAATKYVFNEEKI